MYNESTALAVISTETHAARLPCFTATRKVLLAAMTTICNTIEKRNTIPMLSNVRITGDANGTTLYGTDLDVNTVVGLPVLSEWHDFDATIPAHDLLAILKKSSAETVTFTVATECEFAWVDDWQNGEQIKRQDWQSGKVKIEFDNGACATLQSLPTKDWPEFKNPFEDAAQAYIFQVAAAELVKGLSGVFFAISTEEFRYYLNGVYLNFTASDLHGIQGLCITATDGHQLSHRSIPALVPIGIPGVIVPRKTVAEVLKLLGKKSAGAVKITMNKTKIRFSFGETVITSKLIDGTFPDYERVIPRNNQHVVTVGANALAAMVDQVATVSRERSRAVKLEFGNGRITASVNNPDTGSSSASMAAAMPDDWECTVGFNSRYMLNLCAAATGKNIELHIEDSSAPMLVLSPDDPHGIMVLMPMRV